MWVYTALIMGKYSDVTAQSYKNRVPNAQCTLNSSQNKKLRNCVNMTIFGKHGKFCALKGHTEITG